MGFEVEKTERAGKTTIAKPITAASIVIHNLTVEFGAWDDLDSEHYHAHAIWAGKGFGLKMVFSENSVNFGIIPYRSVEGHRENIEIVKVILGESAKLVGSEMVDRMPESAN